MTIQTTRLPNFVDRNTARFLPPTEQALSRGNYGQVVEQRKGISAMDVLENIAMDVLENIKGAQGTSASLKGRRLFVGQNDKHAASLREVLPTAAILSPEQIGSVLDHEAITRLYGTNFPTETSGHLFHLLLADRLILARSRGRVEFDAIRDPGSFVVPLEIELEGNLGYHREWSAATSFVMRGSLTDHLPLATTAKLQAAVTDIAAGELCGRVGLTGNAGSRTTTVGVLSGILSQVLLGSGRSLVTATGDDYKGINQLLRDQKVDGQLLPSVYTLVRDGLVDLSKASALMRSLYKAHFVGIPCQISEFVPSNLMVPEGLDVVTVAERLDAEIQMARRQPPTPLNPFVLTEGSGVAGGQRQREGDLQTEKEARANLDQSFMPMWIGNRDKRNIGHQQDVVDAGRRFLEEIRPPIILPAYVERTGWDVARASAELVGRDRVLFVSPDKESLRGAAPYACALDQNEIFQAVSWNRLREMRVLPANRTVTLRGKGMTILAGTLWGISRGIIDINNPDQLLAHVDTDIINMDPDAIFYKEQGGNVEGRGGPYRPLEYMAATLALATPDQMPLAVQPAKVGPNRKGEVKFPIFQDFMNYPHSDFVRRVGLALGRVGWPSPGEAIVRADLYLSTPWQVTTGFDLDRYLAAAVLEQLGQGALAQVIIPGDKIENGAVTERADWLEVNWATAVISQAFDCFRDWASARRAVERVGGNTAKMLEPVFPAQYSIEHIREYNTRYAGMEMRVIAPPFPESNRAIDGAITYPADQLYEQAGGPNSVAYRQSPFYLPPVRWMIDNQIIDIERISRVNPL